MTARKRCPRLPARLNLERLEDIEAAGSLLSVTAASLADTAIVRAAEQLSKTPDVERPSTIADDAMDSPGEEA